jgi:hypothetical protein
LGLYLIKCERENTSYIRGSQETRKGLSEYSKGKSSQK